MKTSNKDARKLVNGLTEFEGSNTFAEIYPPCNKGTSSPRALLFTECPTWLYAVYSYGYHFPMYVAEWLEGQEPTWYENTDRYSQSTSKHQSQLRPSSPTIKMDTEQMRQLALHGIVGVVVQPQNNTSRHLTEDDVKEYLKTIHDLAQKQVSRRLTF